MSPALFRIWLLRTLLFALPLLAIGIWDSFEEGLTAFAACLCALVFVSAATYVSFLVLKSILDLEGHPPVDCWIARQFVLGVWRARTYWLGSAVTGGRGRRWVGRCDFSRRMEPRPSWYSTNGT